MANELNIQLDPFLETGLTLVAKVFNTTGTQQDSDVSLSETSTGFYTGDFDLSGLADGDYVVKFQTATEFYGSGELIVKDGAEVEFSGAELIDNLRTINKGVKNASFANGAIPHTETF